MVDLYFSFGVMLCLCGLAAYAGASLQKRARHGTVVSVELIVCVASAAYMNWLWDRPILSRLLPFSGAIILCNWLPIIGSFFLGVCLATKSIDRPRRIVLGSLMVMISAYSLARPMTGHPPECHPTGLYKTLDFQTSKSTCSSACAANLLRLHGIAATEEEMADLCLTRQGTHWMGVYRGLKLKTAGLDWDVVVEEVSNEDLFNGIHGMGILALSFHTPEAGREVDPEWGFASDVGHSVLILKADVPATLEVFDPAPDYGFETWNKVVLNQVRNGILLRLVPRDGCERPLNIDMPTLKRVCCSFPPTVSK